jgi:pimeloyl-ACP methyl ester carboxylesterase
MLAFREKMPHPVLQVDAKRRQKVQKTVILIHGATLNGASWAPVRRILEAAGLNVLTPDLPGHGRRRNEPYTLEAAIETIVAAAKSAPEGPIVLAGDSLGSYTAQASAAHLPADRLKGLVLGGSSHEFIGWPTLPYRFKAAMFGLLFALTDEAKMVNKKIPVLLRGEFGMSDEDTNATMAAGISMSAFRQAVAALCGVDFRAKLAAITQPVMFINGDDDRNHVRGEAAYVSAARDKTVHRFANCDHGVSLRYSGDYADLVKQFTQRVAG